MKRVIIALILVLGLVSVVSAGTRDNLRWTVTCDGFLSEGGGIILDRDNTGDGQERFVITAVDGAGNTIFGPLEETFFIGSRLNFSAGVFFPFNRAPEANPILVTVVSPAGNGLNEQTIYGTVGNCDGLALDNTNALLSGFEPTDGAASPSVQLNAPVPRPTNLDGLAGARDGYLIVNTGSLNLRSGDGPQFTIVGRVPSGTELVVLGRNETRTWWFVQVGEIRGWVNGEFTILRGDLTNAPLTPVTGEIFPARFAVYADINIRVAPFENSARVCVVEGDLEYFIVGQSDDGEWIEIAAMCGGEMVTGWLPFENGAIRNSGDLPIPVTFDR